MSIGDKEGKPLENRIVEWSRRELGCPLFVEPQALRPVCRGKRAIKFWETLLERVQSKEYVARVRTTLALRGIQCSVVPESTPEDEEKERLARLRRKLESLRSSVSQDRQDLRTLVREVNDEQSSLLQEKKHLREKEIRALTLEANTSSLRRSGALANEFQRRAESHVALKLSRILDEDAQPRGCGGGGEVGGSEGGGLPADRGMLLAGHFRTFTKAMEEEQPAEEALHRILTDVSQQHGAREVLSLLSDQAMEEARTVRDLGLDQNALVAEPDPSPAEPANLAASVKATLQLQYQEELRYYAETLRMEEQARVLQTKASHLWKALAERFERQRERMDPGCRSLCRTHHELVQYQLLAKVEEAGKAHVLAHVEDCEERVGAVRESTDKLRVLAERVEKLATEEVDRQMEIIDRLARVRASLLELRSHRESSRTQLVHQLDMESSRALGTDCEGHSPSALYARCPMAAIQSGRLQYQLTPAISGGALAAYAARELRLCPQSSSMTILESLLDSKLAGTMSSLVNHANDLTWGVLSNHEVRKKYLSSKGLAAASQASKEVHFNYHSEIFPRLKQGQRVLEGGAEQVRRLDSLCQEWWDQPSRLYVPWHQYKGKTVQEWESEWKDIMFQLQKL
mmetsp:Transcript_24855/g.69604  ORF Transcript_24855/g.69604 Transcript_24855/m.69604 type:complete len:630 (+) Transcript_24855:107-1996(+)|eukprot:CAMPEP_0119139640 /NCGR_PEP_ID=MMETSP1310-20130426/27844_1 /TAXON_ID=464262 /ORGANISM="Genus nov. species nov., Strain RCC2339" /LENGTH=629 /DNA_ID=CAMNT_0007130951 /DNA_START=72 /DNA_END=1961 /DNA_ORIENTATION=+